MTIPRMLCVLLLLAVGGAPLFAADDASGSMDTNFRVNNFASLTDEMVGWTLQPNVNAQIFLPIIAVDDSANTVSVAGN